MRKCLIAIVALFATTMLVNAQNSKETLPKKIDLSNRANDHIMMQFGYMGWGGDVPDSAKPSGFSRFFNFYGMYDMPFKTNQHLSWGLGLGIGTDNVFFDKKYVDVKANSTTLPFRRQDSVNHFRKFKLATIYADIPVELRYASNPARPDKGYKAAIGVKVGMLLKSYNKGKELQDKSNRPIYDEKYIQKEFSKRFFNTTRVVATGRIGYGNFSLSGSYQITNLLKSGAGPDIKPFTIGLTLSGL